MAKNETPSQQVELNTRLLLAGAVLIGIGGLLALGGAMVGASALVSASRQWVKQLDRPPSEVAGSTWNQLRSATSAGMEGWRKARVG